MDKKADIFLIDSSALITPYKSYYPFDIAPSFWVQIKENIEEGNIALLDVVREEIEKGNDTLSDWCKGLFVARLVNRRQLSIVSHYSDILKYVQTCGLYTNHALMEWSNASEADPWLIAAALETGYTIITFEASAGSLSKKNPSNRCKIPDVCKAFQVNFSDLYDMMRILSINLH